MTTITFPAPADIVEAVREIADEFPTHVYEKDLMGDQECRYEKDGHGDCIIGCALERLGVPTEHIRWLDSAADSGASAAVFNIWYERYSDIPDTETGMLIRWLNRVQSEQDNGTSWGAAVLDADELLEQMPVLEL